MNRRTAIKAALASLAAPLLPKCEPAVTSEPEFGSHFSSARLAIEDELARAMASEEPMAELENLGYWTDAPDSWFDPVVVMDPALAARATEEGLVDF